MEFNIIDGHDDYDYDDIVQDYLNLKLPVKEIREKHKITPGVWQRILRRFKEDNVPLRNLQKRTPRINNYQPMGCKNYTKLSNGKYRVYKSIRGKCYLFGNYETEEEAIARVQELKSNNWGGLL